MLSIQSYQFIWNKGFDREHLRKRLHNKPQDNEVKIVLLGKTGSGKSSFVNTFLGEDVCEVSCSPNSQTLTCHRYDKVFNGREFVVIDTPGVFATERSEEDLRAEIISCLVESAPGPHVFILVLQVTTLVTENQKAVSAFTDLFGEKIFDHLVVLFTHGDKLDNNMTIQDFTNESDVTTEKHYLTLKELSRKCGNRVHVIDNKHWNNRFPAEIEKLSLPQETLKEINGKLQTSGTTYRDNKNQITELMSSIDEVLRNNNSCYYTNPCLEELEIQIKAEERNILQEMNERQSGDQSVDMAEIRRRAQERVRTKTGRILAGVATGTLLGALLGLGVELAAPVVFIAGLIRGWRNLTIKRTLEKVGTMKTKDIVVVVLGIWTKISLVGGHAGVGVSAKVLLLCGAGIGFKSGVDSSKVSNNPNQTAQNVIQTLVHNAQDMLKSCWNVGSKDNGDESGR